MKKITVSIKRYLGEIKAKKLIGIALGLMLSGYILTGFVVWITNQKIEKTLTTNLQDQLGQFVRLTERRMVFFEQLLQGNALLLKSANPSLADFTDLCKDDAGLALEHGADYLAFIPANRNKSEAGAPTPQSAVFQQGVICQLSNLAVENLRVDWADGSSLHKALEAAQNTNSVVMVEAGKGALPDKYLVSRGFYFVYPAVRSIPSSNSVGRRDEMLGWMVLVSRYGHLKQIIQDDYEPNVGFTILTGSADPSGKAGKSEPAEPFVMINRDAGKPDSQGGMSRQQLQARQSVEFGGQPWVYEAVYANDFWFRDLHHAVTVIEWAGLLLSTMLGMIIMLLGGRFGAIEAFINSLKKRLTDSEQFSKDIVTSLAEGVYLTDLEGKITFVNPEAARLLGYEPKELLGAWDHALFHDCSQGEHETEQGRCGLMIQALRGDTVRSELENFRKKDGTLMPVSLMASPVYRAYKLSGMLVSFRDITGERLAKSEIWWRANFDALTGLPNRNLFFDRLKIDMGRTIRDGQMLGLLFIDLDGFKAVNDSRGHEVGDQLLVQVASRIASCLRESDTVSRLGGDEFTVILARQIDPLDIQRVAEKIRMRLFEPIALSDGYVAQISCSIGVALCPQDTTNLDELLVHADNAMYESKRLGRNRISFSSEHIRQTAEFRQMVISDLRKAIDLGQLSFELQPILRVADKKITKAELLARWHHHERGMIPPDEFINVAEKSGAIIELGELIFRQALEWLSQHRRDLPSGFQLGINVSPIQFQVNPNKADTWLDSLRKAEIPPEMICIEMTESALLVNHAHTLANLDTLRSAGVAVALDDFGSGYASLANLRHFSIDVLKIDRQFVTPMTEQPEERVISEGMINLAHRLGITVVAEGVETIEQFELLAQMGCEFVQGYWVSRPVSPVQFLNTMADSGWTVV